MSVIFQYHKLLLNLRITFIQRSERPTLRSQHFFVSLLLSDFIRRMIYMAILRREALTGIFLMRYIINYY